MRFIKKILFIAFLCVISFSDKAFCAGAYLEGSEPTQEPSILDNFDASLIMANWYKIVLIVVAIVCTVGFIVSNLRKNKKSGNKQ